MFLFLKPCNLNLYQPLLRGSLIIKGGKQFDTGFLFFFFLQLPMCLLLSLVFFFSLYEGLSENIRNSLSTLWQNTLRPRSEWMTATKTKTFINFTSTVARGCSG